MRMEPAIRLATQNPLSAAGAAASFSGIVLSARRKWAPMNHAKKTRAPTAGPPPLPRPIRAHHFPPVRKEIPKSAAQVRGQEELQTPQDATGKTPARPKT